MVNIKDKKKLMAEKAKAQKRAKELKPDACYHRRMGQGRRRDTSRALKETK
jgi:hypothetical protein